MKDSDLRAYILQKYYEKRREDFFQWTNDDFKDAPESMDFDERDLYRVCEQLDDYNLIQWKPVRDFQGPIGGAGKITAFGVDVIEGNTKSPISMTFDHSINIHGSSNVQVGNNNAQNLSFNIGQVLEGIEKSDALRTTKRRRNHVSRIFLSIR